MAIKSDRWIRRMAQEHGMINPFNDRQVREGVISYGVSSYGYDLRVADEFKIFTNDVPSAARRARRLAHGNAVGKRINIPERRRRDTELNHKKRANMSHTYVQNLLHVVFSTKERRKLIPLDHRTKLWAYMAGVCSKEKIVPLEIGGMDDHAHLLIQLPPTWSLSDADSGNQDQLIPMDGKKLCMAAWLCRLQRQRVEQGGCRSLHPHTGCPSQEDGLRIRIDCSIEQTRRAIRFEICFRLALCRAYGAGEFHAHVTHGVAVIP